ncbi:AAA family ATPase [Haladaptatus sp. ZSTT2]|uniref:AAA family ATPase n=1 Tax=Haladaptatus sp. ZSTT2 TaxID=3120515 RepID=UPI00300F2F47
MTDADITSAEPSAATTALSIDDAGALAEDIIENVEQVIVGNHGTVEQIVTAILARGHILLEDVPGVGKTMLSRAVARSVDCSFKRVQFTPDLLPSDVTGVNVFNQQTREFEFRPGPIFANFVLGDEINRAPPKTQSSLLEAMEEEQVTVDGDTHRVPLPFTIIATQNSVERNRTYELPMAEVDRFMKKLHLGYPDEDAESEMLLRVVGHHPIEELQPVASAAALQSARETVSQVSIEEPIRRYVTQIAGHTRENAVLGVSPRGSISLLRAAQARAVIDGRDYVIPDDVQQEAVSVLAHRIQLGADTAGVTKRELIEDALEAVSVP